MSAPSNQVFCHNPFAFEHSSRAVYHYRFHCWPQELASKRAKIAVDKQRLRGEESAHASDVDALPIDRVTKSAAENAGASQSLGELRSLRWKRTLNTEPAMHDKRDSAQGGGQSTDDLAPSEGVQVHVGKRLRASMSEHAERGKNEHSREVQFVGIHQAIHGHQQVGEGIVDVGAEEVCDVHGQLEKGSELDHDSKKGDA